jgi:hypothetical protein
VDILFCEYKFYKNMEDLTFFDEHVDKGLIETKLEPEAEGGGGGGWGGPGTPNDLLVLLLYTSWCMYSIAT